MPFRSEGFEALNSACEVIWVILCTRPGGFIYEDKDPPKKMISTGVKHKGSCWHVYKSITHCEKTITFYYKGTVLYRQQKVY